MIGELDANAKMIEDGWAWHFTKYNDEERLAELEELARTEKRGLWADPNPLAPWEFRARKKTPEANAESSTTEQKYWLNTSSNVRHNERCEHFQKTKANVGAYFVVQQNAETVRQSESMWP